MDYNAGTLEKSLVTRDGIPGSDPNPMKLAQSTDKSFLLKEHETVLAEHKKMNAEADAILHFGSTNISFFNIELETSPPTGPSAPVQLIPANCVDISILTQNPDKVMDGKYFLCRTIAPSYRSFAINAIVEDPRGQGIRISLYNYSAWDNCSYDDLLEELPVAQILAIKNPLFKCGRNGEFFLKCDNPDNVVVFSESMSQKLFPWVEWDDEIQEKYQKFIQSTTKTSIINWKNQGNKEFLRQEYEKSVESYTKGLNLIRGDGAGTDTAEITCDMLSNRAAAYLKLDCFQTALDDVEKLLKIDPSHFKGLYRRAKALIALQRFQEAIQFLEQSSNLVNTNSENQRLLLELLKSAQYLLKQQTTGEYDILKLYKAGEVRHNDCADFVGPVKVQKIGGSGRGLVATQVIQPGQLICATKAFQIVFPVQEQGSCNGVVNSYTNSQYLDTFTDSDQIIVHKIVQKLNLEPSLCHSFYQLYAGPDFPIYDVEKDPMMVDVKRIEAIGKYNTFVGNMPNFGGVSQCACSPDKSVGIWIFPSFLNHRCWGQNAIWTTFGDMLFVRAFKEIPIGSEILISYFHPTLLYDEREEFLQALGFMCECQLCQIDRDNSKEGQKRLELLKKIQKEHWKHNAGSQSQLKMEMMMKKLLDLDKGGQKPNLKLNPSLIHPLHDLALFYLFKKYKKSVDLWIKRHALTTNTSMKQLAVDTCFHLITVHLMNGKVQEAKEWTETLKKEIMTLYGTLEVAELMAKQTLDLMGEHNIFIQ